MLKVDKLSKDFGDKIVLKDIDLEINEGEMLAVVGSSGCGKSTLLNIIGLLEPRTSGDLELFGFKNVKPFSKRANKLLREKIGFLFQNYALLEDKSVFYNLSLAITKGSKKNRETRIDEVLMKVGLSDFSQKVIHQCSGGEQQRVAIARLLLQSPKLILADEPTGSLDGDNRDEIIAILKQLNDEGSTIVIVTHDEVVAQACDRIVELPTN